jgi:hypothetical protein
MSAELYEAFQAWREPALNLMTVEDEVELIRSDSRFLGRPMPDPVRFIRKPFRILPEVNPSMMQVVPAAEERILSGCGLSPTGSSTETEVLEPPSVGSEATQFDFSDLDARSDPGVGEKRKDPPCPCSGDELEEGEVCLRCGHGSAL